MACRIDSSGNHVTIAGTLELDQLWRLSATLYNLTTKSGYQDVVLDFTHCTAAMPAPMLGLCAEAASLRKRDVDITLVLPADDRVTRIFINANWAHQIDPTSHKRSSYRGYRNMPAAAFASHDQQPGVVDRMVESILSSIPGIERVDLVAIEWSLNEVTDNVLVHAQAAVGGLVQITNFPSRRRVEFCVADAGVGIPATLRARFPDLTDSELIEKATVEGVTRDPALGQGNGLYGTYAVASANGGRFQILSGYGLLAYHDQQLRLTNEKVPFPGTLVVASMDCSNPQALADALRFGEVKYRPLDYVETRYEDRTGDHLVFRMHEETLSCGSRVAGTPIRIRLGNIVRMNPGRRVIVDMEKVPLMSSSFADEVFGKLFKELGPLGFASSLDICGLSATARSLIDRAIAQRFATSTPGT